MLVRTAQFWNRNVNKDLPPTLFCASVHCTGVRHRPCTGRHFGRVRKPL